MSYDPFEGEGARLAANPFSDKYWKAELKALGLARKTFHVEHVRVGWFKPEGRIEDYLNPNMRFLDRHVPYLAMDDEIWMSLTPMEIQSAGLVLHRAKGHVVTLGLGLGYFSIRAAQKETVQKVTVYEKEELIIDWFKRAYKGRHELAKIELVQGDARKVFKGVTCDFCFADIYQSMLADETLPDVKLFRKQNQIKRYMFWGYERVVRDLLALKMLRHPTLYIGYDLINYLRHWQRTPAIEDDPNTGTLADLNWERDILDQEFLKQAKRLLTDFPI